MCVSPLFLRLSFGVILTLVVACPSSADEKVSRPWQEIELTFTAQSRSENPYVSEEAWVNFTHEDGTVLRRQMFWDGGQTFRVRFASTHDTGTWNWNSVSSSRDPGLHGKTGTVKVMPHSPDDQPENPFYEHGFWSIPKGGRNLIHSDGTPRLLCADTPWALPWRATVEQVRVYAKDRKAKGFNAALLMTVQPDRKATGPRNRTEDGAFEVGFEDLPKGTLQQLNPDYFQTFDSLVEVLVEHGIAPVYQPVFHGYGWKGKQTAGNSISPEDYARYCRYLVARYGARPAIWLINGDGPAVDPQVVRQLDLSGRMIEQWDAYDQPTGLHYSPHALNRTHQDKDWLDFQWCQTGHSGEHVPERVMDMWHQRPVKAVANGEPTYENIGRMGNGAGWWQGHEAWCNLTAGGTMGVVYGAGSLWQWRLHPDEPGHADWCVAPDCGWRQALDFEGSRYPGIAAKIFEGLPLEDMQPNWHYTLGRRALIVPNKLFVLYLPTGGSTTIYSREVPRTYRVYDPKTGAITAEGKLNDAQRTRFDCGSSGEPRVTVFVRRKR